MSYMFQLDETLRSVVEDALKSNGFSPENKFFERIYFELAPVGFASNFNFSTNAPILVAMLLKKSPNEVGKEIAEGLLLSGMVDSWEVARKGFLNIKMSPRFYSSTIINIVNAGSKFGFSNLGSGEMVNIEYVSANPTGPMHIGHARGAVYGDVLSMFLKESGFNVTKEYYVNDAGSQIDTLVKSAFLRYMQAVDGAEDAQIPEGCYPGEYLIPVGKLIFEKYGKSFVDQAFEAYNEKIRKMVVDEMLLMIKEDLKKMNISHDKFSYESEIVAGGSIKNAMEILKSKNLIYTGKTEKPKGILKDDWEEKEQLLFRSTDFGDDVDRPIQKSDGSFAYFAPDIGYHYDKYMRGFKKMVLVLGADHKGYVKRIKAAVEAFSDNEAQIDVKLCELVTFIKDGEEVKSSKRSGNFVTLADILGQLNAGILRFIMLTRKNDTRLKFDINKALEQSKDNPVFYVQYAHSRCCSLIRNFEESFGEKFESSRISNLKLDEVDFSNSGLAKILLLMFVYPRIIANTIKDHELHKPVEHIIAIATAFHSAWNGADGKRVVFVDKSNKDTSLKNLAVVFCVKETIGKFLTILGIEPMEKM